MYTLKSAKVVTFNLKRLAGQQRMAAGLRSAAKNCAQVSDYDGSSEHLRFPN